jgi:hypothetical protein
MAHAIQVQEDQSSRLRLVRSPIRVNLELKDKNYHLRMAHQLYTNSSLDNLVEFADNLAAVVENLENYDSQFNDVDVCLDNALRIYSALGQYFNDLCESSPDLREHLGGSQKDFKYKG